MLNSLLDHLLVYLPIESNVYQSEITTDHLLSEKDNMRIATLHLHTSLKWRNIALSTCSEFLLARQVCKSKLSSLLYTVLPSTQRLKAFAWPSSVELSVRKYIATESDVDHERAWNWIQELYKFTVSGVSGSLNTYYFESSLLT